MYYLIGSLVALIGILVAINHFKVSQQNKRIDDFIQNFFQVYKGSGVVMELLLPSGINNLINDKEIEKALEKLKNRIGFPPFRQESRIQFIKKYGYKKFFQYAIDKKIQINPTSVDLLMEELETEIQ